MPNGIKSNNYHINPSKVSPLFKPKSETISGKPIKHLPSQSQIPWIMLPL